MSILTLFHFLFLLLFQNFVNAQDKDPYLVSSRFENLPTKIYYFDDTTSILYHDGQEGTVYVSSNEGKTWLLANGVDRGAAVAVIEHPFDNNVAFILGREKKHWRTMDKGRSWQSFETPEPPNFSDKPLAFHVDNKYNGHIIFHSQNCERHFFFKICRNNAFYTTDAFSSEPKSMLKDAIKCVFAHSSKEFKHDAPLDLVFCIAEDKVDSDGLYKFENSRLMSSTDWFQTKTIEELGIGQKRARGIMALTVISKFAIVALRDLDRTSNDNMELFVTADARIWARAEFPHASSSGLRENAYTILQGTTHSLAIDVLLRQYNSIGTLFVSNSNGTFFTESLRNTNRSPSGFVDFEAIYGVEGVGIANIVDNADSLPPTGSGKKVRSVMTFDDGHTWKPIKAPETDVNNQPLCQGGPDTCSLHLHSVTDARNYGRIFSSPAPGYVMGIGNAGYSLKTYEESGTYLSSDAGRTWKEINAGPTKYEFGGKGSVLVTVADAGIVDEIRYSLDSGNTWSPRKFPDNMQVSPKGLLTVPDSTSLKFLLLGTLKGANKGSGNHVVIFIDFSEVGLRTCEEGENSPDFERWYARTSTGSECVMGHKQFYWRRKPDAKCFVGHKFEDPAPIEENCSCTDEDYECDYNFVMSEGKCVPAGPLPSKPNDCQKGEPDEQFLGSSGYRKIPGNTCTGGVEKDKPELRDCKNAQPIEGTIVSTIHDFPSLVVQNEFFTNSTTLLVRLYDNSVWQSANEGYSWTRLAENDEILAFYVHPFSRDRAYLVTSSRKVYYTINRGQSWDSFEPPSRTNIFGLRALAFHPLETDYLIWTGTHGCDRSGGECAAEAQYSTNNGRSWKIVEKYVRNCQWARDKELLVDAKRIMCESYRDKKGDQRTFFNSDPLQLVIGSPFYANKQTLFANIVGFAKFSEYLLVAEYKEQNALDLQVSLDGKQFSTGLFPPSMRPDNHAYTILESSTDSVFLHLTTSDVHDAKFGNILKSNSNGTYYGLSAEYVSRNNEGYVDFEKMKLLEGIALINVVANPDSARITRSKQLQTRITYNDGGSWKPLNPPPTDSLGQPYACSSTKCALHIHGFTERTDARATFSSFALPGVLMGVGNVGESLAPYKESDTFLSRDGGFTWEEIRKDAHLWEFGDSGSVLVLVNDEEPTDKLLYSTDEGLSWREYSFDRRLRVRYLRNAPSDKSRKFILFGHSPTSNNAWTAVHIDFSALTPKKCVLNLDDPSNDDFELWSPAETREEKCLFGRQTLYHRRIRNAKCFVGDTQLLETRVTENCQCTKEDFECDYNYIRNAKQECVLAEGAEPLPIDTSWDTCNGNADYWYERTAYRKIPHSSCEGGLTLHLGAQHNCPGLKHHGFWFWMFMALIVLALTSLFSLWWRRSGLYRGSIRLPDRADGTLGLPNHFDDSGPLATIASIPWFVMGVAATAWSKISPSLQRLPFFRRRRRQRGGYRNVAIDEDAQILRFEDERQ